MLSKRAEIELLDAVSVYFHHATPGLGPGVELIRTPSAGFVNAARRFAECSISMSFYGVSHSLLGRHSPWPISR